MNSKASEDKPSRCGRSKYPFEQMTDADMAMVDTGTGEIHE
jgi:hypothetical protein